MLKLDISVRGLIVIALILAGVWMLRELWPVVVVVLVSLIFMAALLPYFEWLVHHGLKRGVALLAILLGLFVLLAGMVALVVPAVISEFRDLRDNLPEDARRFEDFAGDLGFDTESWNLRERAEEINWTEIVSGRAAVDYTQRVLFFLVTSVTVIVITAYMLLDAPRMKAYLFRFIPPDQHETASEFLLALRRVVGGYVRGQTITSAIIGVFTMGVLFAAGVPNAAAYGVLAAFADIIPLIGAFIAIIPPVVAAFQESPTQALIVLGALLAYQQFEDRFLVPKVYGQTLNLPPVIVLVAVLIGGELLGITGILLALPTAAALRVVLDSYLAGRLAAAPPELPGGDVLAPDADAVQPSQPE